MAANKILSLFVVALCLVKASSDTMACKSVPMGTVLPNENDCRDYFLCLYGRAFNKTCSKGKAFSVAAKGCVDYDKSDCQMKTPKPTVAPSTKNNATCINEERPENKEACKGQSFGVSVPYPGNCRKFLVCNCENPTVENCPAGTMFDKKLKNCNFPYNVDCVEESDPVPYKLKQKPQPVADFTVTADNMPRWSF